MSNLTTRESTTVSETKKGAIQGIAGAGAVEAFRWGVPIVLSALGAFWAWWKGLAFPWTAVFGLGVVLVLAIVANLITSMIVKLRKPSADDPDALPPELGADHSECSRTIEDLEAEVKRLHEQVIPDVNLHAQCKNTIRLLQEDLVVHSSRANTNEAIFKSFEEKYKVAIRVSNEQASRIGEFVEVLRVCTHDPKLDDPMPTFKWEIKLKNRSVHRISLYGDVGPLFFEGHKLTEHKELLENKVMGLYPDRDGSIIFEQRLSPPEVKLLKSLPNGKFEFDKVMLYVKGSDAEHVTPHRVVIFSRFRATLGRCSDERSQAVEELSAQMACLRTERDQLMGQVKSQDAVRLKFEIDVRQTQMQYRGYSDSGKTALIGALVRLRCSKEGDSKLAVREFLAEIRSEGNEAVFDDGKLIRAWVDNDAKDNVNIEAGWTIDEPLTEFRFYDFMFEISNEALRIVGRDLFVRITMQAIGQEPQHKDFFVNSWQDAIKSASGISLRRAN